MIKVKKKTLKVGKYVDTKHVDNLIRNYKKERWVHNTERLGKEDSLSSWYSVEELEQFLATAKSHGADGVRVYFGAYSEDFAEQPLFAGRQTLVFVGTKRKETPNGEMDKDIYVQQDKQTKILAYNLGRICPPYCGGKGFDVDGGLEEIGVTIVDTKDKGLVVI